MKYSFLTLGTILFLFVSPEISGQMDERFELKKLGRGVNTFYDDVAPIVTPDGLGLYYFISNHPDNRNGKKGSQDVWFSKRDSLYGPWGKSEHLGNPFNAHQYNQVMSISSGGKTILLRGGKKPGDQGGLSIVRKSGDDWSSPVDLEVDGLKDMNKGRFSGAFLSDDEKVLFLYFSEIPNTIKSDIYVSFPGGGKWTRPKKIPSPINTNQDEFGPFLMTDGKTLYFSSSRSGGFGGLDVYKSVRLDDSYLKWSKPENVGKPVNTKGFDAYFSTSENGEVAFSTRAYKSADGGSMDILEFLPKPPVITINIFVFDRATEEGVEAFLDLGPADDPDNHITEQTNWEGQWSMQIDEPHDYHISANSNRYLNVALDVSIKQPKSDTTIIIEIPMDHQKIHYYLAGIISDEETFQPVDGDLFFTRREDGAKVKLKTHHGNGRYEATLPGPGDYDVIVKAEHYLELIDSLTIEESEEDLHASKDFEMTRIKEGLTVTLENIFFDYDKATLRPESYPELNKLVDLLNKYPEMAIEISGHTDSDGSDEYNLNLSQNRANSCRQYVVDQGVSEDRITSKGYGETQPIASNDTEEGKQTNRRVQFTVLDY